MHYGKYKLWVHLGLHKRENIIDLSEEIEESEWQKMTKSQQHEYIENCLEDFVNEKIESGWCEVDD